MKKHRLFGLKKQFMLIFFLVTSCLLLVTISFAEDTLTITTYYPSPYGSYRELGWGNYPNTRGKLVSDQGSSIELGGSGTPYIDFSNDMASDYDVRIRLTGNDTLAVEGGILTGAVSCIRYTFTASSGTQSCPAGYAIAAAPLAPTATSGNFLCCLHQ